MVVLDFFIVNVGLPSIQARLHAGTTAVEWVVAGYALTSAIFVISGMYDKWWRYVGQRDYLAIGQAVVVVTLFAPAFVALTHPVVIPSGSG